MGLALGAQREEMPVGVSSASLSGFPETGRPDHQMSGPGWPCCTFRPAPHAWLSCSCWWRWRQMIAIASWQATEHPQEPLTIGRTSPRQPNAGGETLPA